MNKHDVAIIGAGPVGSFLAQELAIKGIHVGLYEEHTTIGEPLHCAGLVTPRVFELSKCCSTGIIQNKIYGAYLHSPSGSILAIGGDTVHALVINRQRFDETLAHNAQTAGAELFSGHKVLSAKKHDNQMIAHLQKQNKTISTQCNILIGADGPHSRIRKLFGFPQPSEMLQGIGAEIADITLNPKFVHIFVGRALAPGFFAWVIPTDIRGNTARIGLCIGKQTDQPLQQYLTALLQQPLLQNATVIKKFGGAIPLGPLKKTATDNVMIVGDAAAQVKPTSGGGIYTGLLCAAQCAITAEDVLQKKQFDEYNLKHYHARWTKEIGRELTMGMRFRKIFTRLTDTQLTKYIEKINNTKTIGIINTYGDIDYPSRLALPLLRTAPSLLSLAPSLLKRKKQ